MRKLTFRLLLLQLIAVGAWAQTAPDIQVQLNQIQENLCANKKLNSAKTEGNAPCVTCIPGNTADKASSSSKNLADLSEVANAVLSETERKKIDEMEMAFFLIVDEKDLFQRQLYGDMSLDDLKKNVVNNEQALESLQTWKSLLPEVAKPEGQAQVQKMLDSGQASPLIKKILLEQIKSQEVYDGKDTEHYKSYMKSSQDQLKSLEEQANQNPTNSDSYKNTIEQLKKTILETKQKAEAVEIKKAWLLSGGDKNKLTADHWLSVQTTLKGFIMTEQAGKDHTTAYDSIIFASLNETSKLKKIIYEKQNVQKGPIHTSESQSKDLQFFRSLATTTVEGLYPNPGFKACGMSDAEILAIKWYTGNNYNWINGALRSGGPEAEKVRPFQRMLDSALDKLRSFEGEVKRGTTLPPQIAEQHSEGKIVDYSAFTSTSLAKGFGGSHQFVIKSKKGKYVGSHSTVYSEHEVLFKAGTKFKILSKETIDTTTKIVMEEVLE